MGFLFSIPSSLRSSMGKILPTPGTFHSVQRHFWLTQRGRRLAIDVQSGMAREATRPTHPWTKNHLAQNVNNGRGWGTQVWLMSISSSMLYGYWALNKCSRNKGMNKSKFLNENQCSFLLPSSSVWPWIWPICLDSCTFLCLPANPSTQTQVC